MASSLQQTSLDVDALSSLITAISDNNPGISSLTWGGGTSTPPDRPHICIKMPSTPPANRPLDLAKIFLCLSFHAVLALYFGSPNSSPPIPTVLFGASFAVSCAGLFFVDAFPRVGRLLERISALFAVFGICVMASLQINHNYAWICWLACAFPLLAFILSFK